MNLIDWYTVCTVQYLGPRLQPTPTDSHCLIYLEKREIGPYSRPFLPSTFTVHADSSIRTATGAVSTRPSSKAPRAGPLQVGGG